MFRAADGQPRFFHGTEFDDAKRICREGFRVAHLQRETFTEETPWGWTQEYTEEWLRISTGNLGTGIYVSTDPGYAWTYGDTLLEVAITPGTRILDISIEPDRAVLAYLKREFGKDILSDRPRRVLPRNKRLTERELVSIVQWHAHEVRRHLGRQVARSSLDGPLRTTPAERKYERHAYAIHGYIGDLKRYGYRGFGYVTREDGNGVLVFAGDRLQLQRLVASTDGVSADAPAVRPSGLDTDHTVTLPEIEEFFARYGSERAKRLAAKIERKASRPGWQPDDA